jgi:hypothetical protein
MATKPSMGRRQIKHWAEDDAYTSWRQFYCYLQRAGAVKSIKRMTHRRERRQARADIRRELINQ